MICPNCKNDINDKAKFCPKCGQKISGYKVIPEESEENRSKSPFVIVVILIVALLVGIAVFFIFSTSFFKNKLPLKNEFSVLEESEGEEESVHQTVQNQSLSGSASEESDSMPDIETIGETMFQDGNDESEMDTVLSSTPESDTLEKEHTYRLFKADVSWSQAKLFCEESGGHLATVTSEQEYRKICKLLDDTDLQYIWIGGRVKSGCDWGDSGGWITDEDWTYDLNWYPNEPSYFDLDGTTEDCLCLWHVRYNDEDIGWTFNDQRDDLTNQVSTGSGKIGYICEYE